MRLQQNRQRRTTTYNANTLARARCSIAYHEHLQSHKTTFLLLHLPSPQEHVTNTWKHHRMLCLPRTGLQKRECFVNKQPSISSLGALDWPGQGTPNSFASVIFGGNQKVHRGVVLRQRRHSSACLHSWCYQGTGKAAGSGPMAGVRHHKALWARSALMRQILQSARADSLAHGMVQL